MLAADGNFMWHARRSKADQIHAGHFYWVVDQFGVIVGAKAAKAVAAPLARARQAADQCPVGARRMAGGHHFHADRLVGAFGHFQKHAAAIKKAALQIQIRPAHR